jgi:hypothetical protein
MDIDKILAVIDNLSTDELQRLKLRIAEREQTQQRTAEQWLTALDAAITEFRGDSSEEEMQQIFEAMSMKSVPSEKDT